LAELSDFAAGSFPAFFAPISPARAVTIEALTKKPRSTRQLTTLRISHPLIPRDYANFQSTQMQTKHVGFQLIHLFAALGSR
jgi:hypothetical protein